MLSAADRALLARAAAPPAPVRFAVGLDLGRTADFSALASLEWPEPPPPVARPERVYNLTTLRRWSLGAPYLQVARETAAFLHGLPHHGSPPVLAVDATGVGDSVYELVVAEMARLRVAGGAVAVTITGGDGYRQRPDAPGRWNVSKRALVSNLRALMGRRRLRVAAGLPDLKALLREFDAFTVKLGRETSNESFEAWRQSDHDDMVLAVCLAAFAGERLCPPPKPQARATRLMT
jgi:hypothetical protein